SMSAMPMPATTWSIFSVRRAPSHFTLSWPMRLAMLSKSFLPPAAAAALALVLRLAAKGPRARTPPPKPAFLRNDLRLCPLFKFCSKGNLPDYCCADEGRANAMLLSPQPQMADEHKL